MEGSTHGHAERIVQPKDREDHAAHQGQDPLGRQQPREGLPRVGEVREACGLQARGGEEVGSPDRGGGLVACPAGPQARRVDSFSPGTRTPRPASKSQVKESPMRSMLLALALLVPQDPPACDKCGKPACVSSIRWEGTPTEAAKKAKAEEK